MRALRSALFLGVFGALGACDQATNGDYQTYDPDAVDEMGEGSEASIDTAAPAPEAEMGGTDAPVVLDANETLTALAGPSNGRWMWPGLEPGLAAGEAACQALGSDHVCSEVELNVAARAGELQHLPKGISIWAAENNAPPETNCRGFSYETADQGMGRGARAVPDMDGGLRWDFDVMNHVGFDAACLKDHGVCPQYMPSHQGCNIERFIPCCG